MKKLIFIFFLFSVAYAQRPIVNGWRHAYDADAQAYFTKLELDVTVTSAQKGYINTFIVAAKANGYWSLKNAIYLPIWANASADKWNLKDLRDLDAAFRLTFTGTQSHTSSGIDPDGSSGYANTFLTPSGTLSLNSSTISIYVNESGLTGNYGEMGVGNSDDADAIYIILNYGGFGYYRNNSTAYADVSTSATSGYYQNVRTSSTTMDIYRNGSSILSGSVSSTALNSGAIHIGRYHRVSGSSIYSARRWAFATIGSGLTSTQASDEYNDVLTLLTAFGIN